MTESGSADDIPDKDASPEVVDQRYMVPGLVRGLAILRLFDGNRTGMKFAEIAGAAGLSRSAAFRLIYTLEKENYIRRDPHTRRYAPTSDVLSLGFSYLNAQPLTEIVHPHLRHLSAKTNAASHLVQLDDIFAVYLARVAPAATLVSNLQIGTRLPAHATASGRVLISGLEEQTVRELYNRMLATFPESAPLPLDELIARAVADRKRAHVMSESIFDPGVVSFASPVLDASGTVVAALNVVGPRNLIEKLGDESDIEAIVGGEARALSDRLGYHGGRP